MNSWTAIGSDRRVDQNGIPLEHSQHCFLIIAALILITGEETDESQRKAQKLCR